MKFKTFHKRYTDLFTELYDIANNQCGFADPSAWTILAEIIQKDVKEVSTWSDEEGRNPLYKRLLLEINVVLKTMAEIKKGHQ